MKKLYSILLLTVCACNVIAQTPDKKFSFMLKGGINLANYQLTEPKIFIINDDTEYKNFVGYNFSALANVKITPSLSLQSGLGISQKGTKMQVSINFRGDVNEEIGTGVEKFRYRITYLELPLNLLFNYKKLCLGAGPYLAYALAAKSIIKPSNIRAFQPEINPNTTIKSDIPIGNDDISIIKPIDFGFNFLADYKLKYGISLGINYGLGLTKASKLPLIRDGRNRVFSVFMGYNF